PAYADHRSSPCPASDHELIMPVRSLHRIIRLPQGGGLILEVNLNCSESTALWHPPGAPDLYRYHALRPVKVAARRGILVREPRIAHILPLLRALETELLHRRAPLQSLGLDVAAHLLDCRRLVRDQTDRRAPFPHCRLSHDPFHLGMQPVDDRLWRLRRHQQHVP